MAIPRMLVAIDAANLSYRPAKNKHPHSHDIAGPPRIAALVPAREGKYSRWQSPECVKE
jgi:hypothetical protein